MQDGAGHNQNLLQQQQPQQQQRNQRNSNNSVILVIIGIIVLAAFIIGMVFLLDYMKGKNITDNAHEVAMKQLELEAKKIEPIKLEADEKVFSQKDQKIHKDDIESKTLDVTVQLKRIELEQKAAELLGKPVNKTVIINKSSQIPTQNPPLVNNNGWESPLKDLNNKVDENQIKNDKRFDIIETNVKGLGDQVSDVNQGVNWLINQAQKPDKKTSEMIREQQKQKVTNNTEE